MCAEHSTQWVSVRTEAFLSRVFTLCSGVQKTEVEMRLNTGEPGSARVQRWDPSLSQGTATPSW